MEKQVYIGNSDEDLARAGVKRGVVEPWEDGMYEELGVGNFEWWYFDAHMSDGTAVVVVFFTKFYEDSALDAAPYTSILIVTPDGTPYMGRNESPKETFYGAKDKCKVISGPCTVEGNLEMYSLHAEDGDIKVDLTYNRIFPSIRPGDGKFHFGQEHYMGWICPIPAGSVSGTLEYGGEKHQVSGTGYHDHDWGNCSLSDCIYRWAWTRGHVGDYVFSTAGLEAAEKLGGERVPILFVATKDGVIADDPGKTTFALSDMVLHEQSGKEIPHSLKIMYKDNDDRITITCRHKMDLWAVDNRERMRLEAIEKQIKENGKLNSWYFRFLGDITFDINLGGKKERFTQTTIWELADFGL